VFFVIVFFFFFFFFFFDAIIISHLFNIIQSAKRFIRMGKKRKCVCVCVCVCVYRFLCFLQLVFPHLHGCGKGITDGWRSKL
jgi:hypothetical protein